MKKLVLLVALLLVVNVFVACNQENNALSEK